MGNSKFVFIITLFLIIVILSVMLIFLGKDIYTGINEDRESNYLKRVSLSYVANKIRQSDKENSVRIEEINNNNSIVISEIYDEEIYETWIYFYDNGLYEIFKEKDMEFNPEDGMRILDIDNFEVEQLNDNLLKFTASSSNISTELILNIYSQ